MKLLLLSDLHLELSDIEIPEQVDFDVAVLAGDILWPGQRLHEWVARSPALRRARAVVAVSGNHEYFDSVLQQEAVAMQRGARALAVPPLHLLDAAQVVIDGVRFLGCTLWTDFELHIDTVDGPVSDRERGIDKASRAMADYRSIGWCDAAVPGTLPAPRKLTPHDTLRMHVAQRRWLQQRLDEPFGGPTVVVTHHGPHRGSLAPRFAADWVSTAYLSELPARFFEVPVLWVHGHTHSSHDYLVGGCRVLCNPRGYHPPGLPAPENAAFNSGLVVSLPATERTA
jgi:Icc-related predicted phosphoesterase